MKIKYVTNSGKLNKNILFIMQLPPPIHGVSLMNSYVLNSQIIRKNYDIDFVNLQFSKSINEISKFSFKKIFKVLKYGFLILKKVLIQKPDLVYFTLAPVGFAFYRDAFYVMLLKMCKMQIVFHLHGKGIKINADKSWHKGKIYGWVFNKTHVICLSQRLIFDIKKIHKLIPYIVPNGIPLQENTHKADYSQNSIPQILYLSNYIQSKGILVLIKALGILKNKGFEFEARLVGAPGDLTVEMLEKIILEEDLSELINVTGPKFGNDKISEFQKADIFVFPTYNDAFPLVCIEAMQFSLPVISTFEGGIPDIVADKKTGFIIEPQNVAVLAAKIEILLKDENLRKDMGKKGYERFLNNFTINHFENNMNATFQAILGL